MWLSWRKEDDTGQDLKQTISSIFFHAGSLADAVTVRKELCVHRLLGQKQTVLAISRASVADLLSGT